MGRAHTPVEEDNPPIPGRSAHSGRSCRPTMRCTAARTWSVTSKVVSSRVGLYPCVEGSRATFCSQSNRFGARLGRISYGYVLEMPKTDRSGFILIDLYLTNFSAFCINPTSHRNGSR